jgi:glucose-6-phosphate dehydrogenase assembly protein OpcA
VVTDEESAQEVTRLISELSGHYPSRSILMISDPDEEEANLRIGLSAFCSVRGGSGDQVCAEQITLHVEGPPARHLESLAGPLLIPDLPVFLWYPNGDVPHAPECDGMAALADRLVLDSGAADDCEASLRRMANLLEESGVPAIGDLRWAALSPWRSLVADLFTPPERARELAKIRRVEILHHRASECQALLFSCWLSTALGWHPELANRTEEGRVLRFTGPSGDVTVELSPTAPDTPLRRVRLYSEELTFQVEVSRHAEHTDACSTVMRGDELLAERTVHLRSSDPGVLLGEELRLLGRDETYESALKRSVEMLGS